MTTLADTRRSLERRSYRHHYEDVLVQTLLGARHTIGMGLGASLGKGHDQMLVQDRGNRQKNYEDVMLLEPALPGQDMQMQRKLKASCYWNRPCHSKRCRYRRKRRSYTLLSLCLLLQQLRMQRESNVYAAGPVFATDGGKGCEHDAAGLVSATAREADASTRY